jgi:hypothetical protein
MLGIAEEQGCSTINEQLPHLVGVKSRIEGHGRSAGRDNSKICRHPPRVVRSQNRDSRVSFHPCRKPIRNTFRHRGQFRKSNPLHRLLALNLERNVVGIRAGRLLEALVEGGHVGGEYTKDFRLN